jgi:cytochrome c biogenesis protein CcmG/thiol:disulfide interchange protein DsbE
MVPELRVLPGLLLAVVLATLSGCVSASSPPATPDVDTRGQPSLPVTVPNLDGCGLIVKSDQPATPTKDEDTLPELTLPCLTPGPSVDLAHLNGRPTVVNLWATWCTPCREEMPALQAAHDRHRDVQFLGVDTKDRADWAQEFLPLVKVRYPQVVDADGRLLAILRSPGLPVTVVLDRDGRVVGRQIGKVSAARLDQLIASARG